MKSLNKFGLSALLLTGAAALFSGCEKGPNFETYTYPAQTATGIFPASGYPGTDVTISGKDFGDQPGAVKVFFNGVKADTVRSCANDKIVVKIPASAVSGKVTLQVWTTTNDSIGTFTVIPAPTFKSVSSNAGSPGDVITIKGTGFGADLSKLSLSFNGTSGTISSAVDTMVTATVPAGFKSGNLLLTVNGYTLTGPSFGYLVPVPAATYQLDFENNLNEANGGAAATYTQGAASPLSYVNGISGKAVSLAGYANPLGGTNNGIYNQILALPANAAQYNELTVAAWVNWATAADWCPIFDFGATRGNHIQLLARASSGWNGAGNNIVGRTMFEKVTGFPSYFETDFITSSVLSNAAWHQVAITASQSAKTFKVYLDGVLIKTGSLPAGYDLTLYNQAHAYIGAPAYGTANEPAFAGAVDKFQIFNSVLSDNQIYTLYFKK